MTYDSVADVAILAPTRLEYYAVRATVRGHAVSHCGVGLSAWNHVVAASALVVVGLAGSLVRELPPGSVLVPHEVALADGTVIACDGRLTRALELGARSLGFKSHTGRMLTAERIVTGAQREEWARRGFVAADMEAGILPWRDKRIASLRVVLDSPEHPISPDWQHPALVMRKPALWPELFWLAIAAPWYAVRAACVLRAGLARLESAQ